MWETTQPGCRLIRSDRTWPPEAVGRGFLGLAGLCGWDALVSDATWVGGRGGGRIEFVFPAKIAALRNLL